MATYILQNSAQQIDEAVTAAYPSLVLGGTGFVRNTGAQIISGVKTFADQAVFSSGVNASGPSQISNVQSLSPSGNGSVDFGSSANQWKTGWFSGISGKSAIFQDVVVLGSFSASIPAPVLNNSTGNNVTLSGITNINSANVSGGFNVAGTSVFSGNLNVTGNSIFNGTINATGNKTFSGTLSQSGTSIFIGNFGQSGTVAATGAWNHTGTFNQTGASNFQGAVTIDCTNAATTISGSSSQFNVITNFGVNGVTNITGSCNISGVLHAINGNIVHTGAFNHSGATVLVGETRNTGNFSVIGSTLLSGQVSAPSGITASGNSTAPALQLNRNLTTSPSGGAIEYGNDGRIYVTNEITGAPNRLPLNAPYSLIAPSESNGIALTNTGIFYPILNNTGIYLNTGTYKFTYNTNLNNTGNVNSFQIRLGLFSSGNTPVFNKRHGLAYKRYNGAIGYSYNITGSGYGYGATNIFGTSRADETYVFSSGNQSSSNGLQIDGPSSTDNLNNFLFESVVTLTGFTKVFPVISPTSATGFVNVREFNMQITPLATGTGLGTASAAGPWSTI
jgi:hypothetical protein